MNGTIVIAAAKPWTIVYAERFKAERKELDVRIIFDRRDMTEAFLKCVNPKYIFFPHWSWYIPQEIYERYNCIVFHPTDLPSGRGGSPIQNLISAGFEETVISAIKVVKEIDAGNIYAKRKLSLLGGGEEVFLRFQSIIFNDIIPYIISNDIVPTPQKGESHEFKRRTPEMSEIQSDLSIQQVFNFIRMLDVCEYPNAFIKFGDYTLTFSRPSLKSDGIIADVVISRRINND